MPIRIISWNIKFYTDGVFKKHRNTILNQLWDTGTAASKCDIFVIVEPKVGTQPAVGGEYIAGGAGAKGVIQLYYELWTRSNTWRVVPPRASCAGSKADFCAIFYDSAKVTLVGPDTGEVIPAAVVVAGGGGAPVPWGPADTVAGQIVFYDDGGTEIDFLGRAPYAVQFREVGQVATTVNQAFTLTVTAPALPVAGASAVKTARLPPAAPNERYRVQLEAEHTTGPVTWTVTAGAFPAGLVLAGATGVISGVPTTAAVTSNVTLTATDNNGPVSRAFNIDIGTGLRFATPAALPEAVQNVAYAARISAVGGFPKRTYAAAGPLPAWLTLETDGRLHGTPPAVGPTVLNVDATDAGPSFFVVGLHAPPGGSPDYPLNANVTAMQRVADIRELTTDRGRRSAVIVGDYNCCPLACCSPDHDAAFTSLDGTFTHQDFNAKTSLKNWKKNAGATAAITAEYRSHYYDHIYTAGPAAAASFGVVDLVALHAQWPTWLLANALSVKAFNIIWNEVAWKKGVSDHLPIKVTITP